MKRMIKSAEEVQYDESISLAVGTCYVLRETDVQHASIAAQRSSMQYAKITKTTNNYVIYDVYGVRYGYWDLDRYHVKKSKNNFTGTCTGNGRYLCFASEDELFKELNIDPNKEFNVSPGTVFSLESANWQRNLPVLFTVVVDVSDDEVVCREYKYCDMWRVGTTMYQVDRYSRSGFAQVVSHRSMHEYSSLQEFVNELGLDMDKIKEAARVRHPW